MKERKNLISGKRGRGLLALLPLTFFAVFGNLGCANSPYTPGDAAQSTIFTTFGDPTSFDPAVSYNTGDAGIIDPIYPSYFRYRYPSQEKIQLELNLGAVQPVVTPTTVTVTDKSGSHPAKGETWTFRIRHDLRFQDDPCFPDGKGRPITANDIVYSFKRMADPKVNCPIVSFVSDKVLGWEKYSDAFAKKGKAHYDDPLPGVQVDPNDPYTFRIALNQSYPQLRFLMAMHFTTPTPREAVEKYGDNFATYHPVGCGAYRMEVYQPRSKIVLVRNPNCVETYPATAEPGDDPELIDPKLLGKRLPFTDKVVMTYLKEPLTAYNLFQQGYLDNIAASPTTAQIIPAAVSLTPELKARGVKLMSDVFPGFDYLAFNMTDPVFGGYTDKKRKLRQAISLAINSQAYIDVIGQGIGKAADFIVPPGLFGYDANYKNPYRQFDPNLAKAKQLLAEAGYPNGIDPATQQKLTLYYDNDAQDPSTRQAVRLYQLQIEQLGLDVQTRDTTFPNFTDRVNKRQNQFFELGWVADYPDPENFLGLLYGPNAAPQDNGAVYQNPKYDALFEQMRSMPDTPERQKIIEQMRAILQEDCPMIALVYDEDRLLTQPWLKNTKPHPIAADTLKYRIVDPEERVKDQAQWNSPRIVPLIVTLIVLVLAIVPAASAVRGRQNRRVRRGSGATEAQS